MALCAGLLLVVFFLQTTGVHAEAVERFAVAVSNGKVSAQQQTLKVEQGDKVEIVFTGDRRLSLHLHGIDIEAVVAPGKPATMAFDAIVAGRFPIAMHGKGSHGALLYIEIHPR